MVHQKSARNHLISNGSINDDDEDFSDDDDGSPEMAIETIDKSVHIAREELNVEHIRKALADVTGATENDIDRIFVEKTVGESEIKVIVTDEYLENIAKPLYLANLIRNHFK